MAFQTSLDLDIELPGLRTQVEDAAPPASKAELTFGVTPARDPRYGYQTWAEHSTDLWHPRTAREWLRHYCTTLMICCRYPERPLARVTKAIRQDFLLASY